MFWLHISMWCFDCFFVWVVSLLARDRLMSPQFLKVHRPPLLPITDQLSKVFERLEAVRLRRFMEHCGVLPTTQGAYQKDLGPCDALLCVSHTLQIALESGQEARIVQINFSAAFDRVNHQGILWKLSSVGIGGSVLCVLTQPRRSRSTVWCSFLIDHSMFWWMDVAVNWGV